MKSNVHPNYGITEFLTTNGVSVKINSCLLGMSPFHLSTDSLNHPAWTGKKRQVTLDGNASRLKKNFSGIEEL